MTWETMEIQEKERTQLDENLLKDIEEEIEIEIANGTRIEQAIAESTGKPDFKYIGSLVDTTYEEMRIRTTNNSEPPGIWFVDELLSVG